MKRCISCNRPLNCFLVVTESSGFMTLAKQRNIYWCNDDDCEMFGVLTIGFETVKKKKKK